MKKSLGDIANTINGYTFKSSLYTNEGLRVIRIANVQNGYISDERPCFYPIEYKDRIGDALLNKGDLLMSLTGNVGRVGIISEEMLPAGLNQRVLCIRPIEPKITRYLYYFFSSDKFIRDAERNAVGAAQLNLSTVWVSKYLIPIYDKDKTDYIVKILECIDKLILIKYKQLNKLDQLIQSRFHEMFGSIYDRNGKFQWIKWKEIVNIINGKDYKAHLVEEGGFPVYGTGGEMARASDYLCPENTIIIGRKGTINNPILVKEKFWNVDTAFGVVPKEHILHYQYFYWFCKQFNFLSLNKATTLPSTTKVDLMNIEMNLPPYEMQESFARFVDCVNNAKVKVMKGIKHLETLKKAQMQKYFG